VGSSQGFVSFRKHESHLRIRQVRCQLLLPLEQCVFRHSCWSVHIQLDCCCPVPFEHLYDAQRPSLCHRLHVSLSRIDIYGNGHESCSHKHAHSFSVCPACSLPITDLKGCSRKRVSEGGCSHHWYVLLVVFCRPYVEDGASSRGVFDEANVLLYGDRFSIVDEANALKKNGVTIFSIGIKEENPTQACLLPFTCRLTRQGATPNL
jgi:hypothetical protein